MFSPSSRSYLPSGSSSRRSLPARFFALPADERQVVLSAIAFLPLYSVLVHARGVRWALQSISTHAVEGKEATDMLRIGALVLGTADALPFRTSCLVRSLVLAKLLLSRGYTCALVVETDHTTPAFAAHAWIDTARGAIGPVQSNAIEITRFQLPLSKP